MKLYHNKIDFEENKNYILEKHCEINYECESPWARKIPYKQYREEWMNCHQQIHSFCEYFKKTLQDERTIAEIIKNGQQEIVGYLWVVYINDLETGFTYYEINELYVESDFQRQGLATYLMQYIEERAVENNVKYIRSATGCDNKASIGLHKKHGYYVYRYLFEKELF